MGNVEGGSVDVDDRASGYEQVPHRRGTTIRDCGVVFAADLRPNGEAGNGKATRDKQPIVPPIPDAPLTGGRAAV